MQLQKQANRTRKYQLGVQSHLLFYLLRHSVLKIRVTLQNDKKVYKKSGCSARCGKTKVTNTTMLLNNAALNHYCPYSQYGITAAYITTVF